MFIELVELCSCSETLMLIRDHLSSGQQPVEQQEIHFPAGLLTLAAWLTETEAPEAM